MVAPMYRVRPSQLPAVSDAEALLTPAQAAKRLGVSLSTVWRLLRRSQLPSIKRRGRRLIPSRAVEAQELPSVPVVDDKHPIWALVGAARSGGAGPGSSNKRFYLNQAK